ncbi:uncharacterized protein V1510DRAFT_405591 [Dipodascopsis tothii]|uniref:uncharacterized protein n=1 Tax=Dipodascopsis tothii TaxID=44089 RepID=UPI0034CD193A
MIAKRAKKTKAGNLAEPNSDRESTLTASSVYSQYSTVCDASTVPNHSASSANDDTEIDSSIDRYKPEASVGVPASHSDAKATPTYRRFRGLKSITGTLRATKESSIADEIVSSSLRNDENHGAGRVIAQGGDTLKPIHNFKRSTSLWRKSQKSVQRCDEASREDTLKLDRSKAMRTFGLSRKKSNKPNLSQLFDRGGKLETVKPRRTASSSSTVSFSSVNSVARTAGAAQYDTMRRHTFYNTTFDSEDCDLSFDGHSGTLSIYDDDTQSVLYQIDTTDESPYMSAQKSLRGFTEIAKSFHLHKAQQEQAHIYTTVLDDSKADHSPAKYLFSNITEAPVPRSTARRFGDWKSEEQRSAAIAPFRSREFREPTRVDMYLYAHRTTNRRRPPPEMSSK